MKKTTIIILCIILTFTFSCKPKLTPEEKLKKFTDSLEIARKVEKEVDSLIKASTNNVDEKEAQLIPASIAIQTYYTSSPNSAGGVDCNIVWINKTDKIVKYATFTVAPYNAVDDMVESSIGGETYKRLKATGPVKPGAVDPDGSTWECIWYNSTIAYMKITGIKLEYTDGTTISTNNAEIIEQVIPKKK